MDPTPGLTFGDLLTPTGMLIASGMIVAVVEIVKAGIPRVDALVSGATLAFVFSAILYIVAALVLEAPSPDAYLATFSAWVVVAGGAMGIRAGADHVAEVRSGTAGLASEIKETEKVVVSHSDQDESEKIAIAELEAGLPVEEAIPADPEKISPVDPHPSRRADDPVG